MKFVQNFRSWLLDLYPNVYPVITTNSQYLLTSHLENEISQVIIFIVVVANASTSSFFFFCSATINKPDN